jgi:hypothetical protein
LATKAIQAHASDWNITGPGTCHHNNPVREEKNAGIFLRHDLNINVHRAYSWRSIDTPIDAPVDARNGERQTPLLALNLRLPTQRIYQQQGYRIARKVMISKPFPAKELETGLASRRINA